MSTIKRISKNAVWLTMAEIFGRIVAFFSVILITRYLSKAGYGQYNFIFGLGLIFGVLANFGFGAYTSREIAKDRRKAPRILGNLLSLKIILSGGVLIMIFAASLFINKPQEVIIGLYLIAFLTVSDALRGLMGSVFQAFEKMHFLAFSRIFERIFYLLILFLVIRFDLGFIYVVGCLFTSSFLAVVFELFFVHFKFARLSLRFDKNFIKKALLATFFFVLNDVFVVIFFKIDSVMITFMKGDVSNATYGAAYNLIYALVFVPMIFSTVLYPVLTRFHKKSGKIFQGTLSLVVKYYLIAAIPVTAFTYIFSQKLINLIYKEPYADSVIVLKMLSFALIFVSFNFVYCMFLNTVEKQKKVAFSSFCAMVFNVVTNFIFIPKYGILGAVSTTIFTEFIFGAVLLYFVNADFKIVNSKTILKMFYVLIAVLLSTLVAFLTFSNQYLSYSLFIITFILALLLLGLFSKRDLDYLKEVLNFKKT